MRAWNLKQWNFLDIAAELHDKLINHKILRDEYLRAMPELKKLKGKKLKTALHYLAVLQTNVALMTIGNRKFWYQQEKLNDNMNLLNVQIDEL